MNKILIKNTIMSIIMSIILLLLLNQGMFFIKGNVEFSGHIIPYSTIVLIIILTIFYIYKTIIKYDYILNVTRFNQDILHQFLNVIVFNNIILTTMIFNEMINIYVGIIIIVIQNIFYYLFILNKTHENTISINEQNLILINLMMYAMLITTVLSSVPFIDYLVPISFILVIIYGSILLININKILRIFF